MKNSEKELKISGNLAEIEKYMTDRVGLGESFDLGVRKLKVLRKDVNVYYVNGLCDTAYVIELLKELVDLNDQERGNYHVFFFF